MNNNKGCRSPNHSQRSAHACSANLQQRVVARVEGHGEGAVHDAPVDLRAKVCG